MPLDLKKYRAVSRSVSVTVGETAFSVSYHPAAFTPNLQKSIAALGENDAETLCKYLFNPQEGTTPLLAGWDVTDGGKPVVISLEVLNGLDYGLLSAIFNAIVEDVRPGGGDPNAPRA